MKLYRGDCLVVMKKLSSNSVDSIVTDPPYGWRFMGKAWDGADIDRMTKERMAQAQTLGKDGAKRQIPRCAPSESAGKYDLSNSANFAFQKFSEEWAREAFRVLKPGGHVLIFCGPRTYHRMACGVEDAGFEIRDQLQWLFGSGFPKSHDVSKGIDKAAGARGHDAKGFNAAGALTGLPSNGGSKFRSDHPDYVKPKGITPEAKQWEGFGTALKPANEPILLARKPLSEKTVAANVLKWGTGGINIDGCRVAPTDEKDLKAIRSERASTSKGHFATLTSDDKLDRSDRSHVTGRFPANLILDETAAAMLDAQSGTLKSGGKANASYSNENDGVFTPGGQQVSSFYGSSGGASRFFYVAKASKREKGDGNSHPTVKPTKLMRYLCRLITPPGGTVLDPFLGSGSTGIAVREEKFKFIGIEKEKPYFEIAVKRLGLKIKRK